MSEQAPGGGSPGSATLPGVGIDLAPGAAVGEYRIQGVLGRGGMGVVYAALQPVIEKRVAIKVLAAQFSATPDLVRRFVDEARAVNRIGHENIIDIFSFGQLPDGRQYFVMEFLEGATLAERLERGDLAPADLPPILIQICDALDAAHAKKIVHRDLKPENVWIGSSTRGAPRVRLLDFGIAKLHDTGDRFVTDVGAVMGTPHFMSPEQCNGRGVDHRTDLYAMGVIMYRLFGGRLPFVGETYAEILGKQITEMPPPPSSLVALPAALDQLILRCLAKNPGDRPQTAGELARALGSIFSLGTFAPRAQAEGSGPQVAAAVPTPVPAVASAPTELPAAAEAQAPATPSASPARAAHARRPVLIAGAVVLAAAALAVWFATRASAPSPLAGNPPASTARAVPEPAPVAGAAPVPVPLPAAPPPAAPLPASTASAGDGAPTPKAASLKRRPTADAKAEAPSKGKGEGRGSRASSSGLVTENPFE